MRAAILSAIRALATLQERRQIASVRRAAPASPRRYSARGIGGTSASQPLETLEGPQGWHKPVKVTLRLFGKARWQE